MVFNKIDQIIPLTVEIICCKFIHFKQTFVYFCNKKMGIIYIFNNDIFNKLIFNKLT